MSGAVRRWRGALSALLLLTPGCFLVPTAPVECSARRACPAGQVCELSTSTCVARDVAGEDAGGEPDPGPRECQGECPPCREHSDCPSLLCDVYHLTPGGGSCVPQSAVIYVDNRNGACAHGGGTGETPQSALCSVFDGLARAATVGRKVLRVMASTEDYGPVLVSGRGVGLYGPAGDGGRARLGGSAGFNAVSVSAGAQVVIDGFDISKGEIGVECSGGESDTRLTLRRSRITGAANLGALVSSCRLEMDRVLLSGNGNGALDITGIREYAITNSLIVKNSSTTQPAVKLGGSASGVFRFNTVADNTSRVGGAIDCGGRAQRIEDSIVVSNPKVFGSQLERGCLARNTVVGPGDSTFGTTASQRLQPRFVRSGDLDYALSSEDPMNKSCCIDKTDDPVTTDYLGTRRPQGPRSDLGAYEAR